ncbi:PREDICTED: probable cytochrome P450 9h1 isoform X1 [Bactrocera latifrons]|uniref:Putative cytochrome P450 9h1 n=1 Tax=Bactrocera latifrons TaxID=174628 RepID=A0A0K8WFI6_BACLA|nr:PREDICTED: probable cytochrome P450 9h1 isoform X1 [Bactrocera latifrons]
MALVEVLILLTLVVFLFYKWSVSKYYTFRDRGIPHDQPTPLIGNLDTKIFLGKSSFIKFIIERYQAYKISKIYGIYSMRDCNIHIRDLELIKKVGIKDFDSFPNHNSVGGESSETFFSKSLIALKDQKWREMRNCLSPAFTGSKMRLMFTLINECVIEAVNYITSEIQASGNTGVDIEMKDFFTRFTNDAIASTAFGIRINSFNDRNNEFYRTGKAVTEFTGFVLFKAILFGLIPKVMKVLRIKLFDDKILKYFNHLVIDAMKYRKEHRIVRPDMIHLLMEAKQHYETSDLKGEHAEFTDEDLLAQCTLFFVAGFETVSACLCFTAHELLENPEIQDRLYLEILDTQNSLDGSPLNYDSLIKMRYMDMVISESLRKWPPVIITDRICSADYSLKDDEGSFIAKIKKGDNIFVPIIGIHRDPDYYPNPNQFDPERFSDENKNKINPMSYLPFGVGPRMCIGNRLALMEVKAIIYHIILNFKIVRTEKTCENLMESISGFTLIPKERFWMKFVPRNS